LCWLTRATRLAPVVCADTAPKPIARARAAFDVSSVALRRMPTSMRRETLKHGAKVQTPYCVGWRVTLSTRRKPLCFSQGYLTLPSWGLKTQTFAPDFETALAIGGCLCATVMSGTKEEVNPLLRDERSGEGHNHKQNHTEQQPSETRCDESQSRIGFGVAGEA